MPAGTKEKDYALQIMKQKHPNPIQGFDVARMDAIPKIRFGRG